MVDANRDGQMSFEEAAIHDKDGTSEQKPYLFWVNNDHDEERTVDSDDLEQDDYDEAPDFDNPGLSANAIWKTGRAFGSTSKVLSG